eukprot:CAMPEP_0172741972 /NCGR_PEP_ID=MMETSP1074-20121228/128405_1 /TAXON_ID=2916 /ORGANISM="Ceratium fusus, Strain PA161109" /LENGTH=55 /DNA_ID=CAMNT_0013572411 /DNA_START=111 /DNA_END=278 /DNA_ORIENTATION=+
MDTSTRDAHVQPALAGVPRKRPDPIPGTANEMVQKEKDGDEPNPQAEKRKVAGFD